MQSKWIYASSAKAKLVQHRWEIFGHSLESAVYSPAAYWLALSVSTLLCTDQAQVEPHIQVHDCSAPVRIQDCVSGQQHSLS